MVSLEGSMIFRENRMMSLAAETRLSGKGILFKEQETLFLMT